MPLPVASAPLSRRAVALACLAIAAVALAATLVRIDDPDSFHHLALGRDIARNGLRAEEPFLYPIRGAHTGRPPYWLGSLAVYGWHVLLGERALSLFPAAAAAALAVVLLLDSMPRGGRPTLRAMAVAALPLALVLETFRYRAAARPEILATLLLAVTMWSIRRLEDGEPRPLLAFPALALLWTNLHPSSLAGIGPIAVFAAAGLASRAVGRTPALPSLRDVALAGAVAAAALAASLATPSRTNPVAAAARFALSALRIDAGNPAAGDAALPGVTRAVAEMQGGGASLWGSPVGVLMLVTALSFLVRPRALRLREVLTVALFAWLPFNAVRFSLMFAAVAAPVAARHLEEACAALPERAGRLPVRSLAPLVALAAALATIPLGRLAPHIRFGTGLVPGAFPVRGADYLAAARFEGRLFNTFGFGGYLEWREVGPPFQDGRGLLAPGDSPAALLGTASPVHFAFLDRKYRFDALLIAVPTMDPAFARQVVAAGRKDDWVVARSTWSLVAFDDAALLYLRRDGRYGEQARRDEYLAANPANADLPVYGAEVPLLLREYARSVAEAPSCVRCRLLLGEMALAAGRPEEAARAVSPALRTAWGPDAARLASVATRAANALRDRGPR